MNPKRLVLIFQPLNLIDVCLPEDIGNTLKYPNAAPFSSTRRGRGEE
jgi:hypothetical protein